MAIQLVTGTLNPASTQKARDIRQAWVAAFAGKTGWTILDDNYVNGTTERSVLSNSAGFAVMIYNSTTLTDTNIRFHIGTSYDTGTHTLLNIGFGSNTTLSFTVPSNGLSGISFNPNAIGSAPTTFTTLHGFVTTSSQSAYTVHIESTYAIMSFKDGSTNNGRAVYIGAFTSLVGNPALTDTYPFGLFTNGDTVVDIFVSALGSESQSVAPRVLVGENAAILQAGAPAVPGYADVYGVNPTLSTVSPVFVTKASRFPNTLEGRGSGTPDPALHGWLRGKLNSVLHANPISAAYQDNITVAGKTYAFLAGANTGNTSSTNAIGWWVEVP